MYGDAYDAGNESLTNTKKKPEKVKGIGNVIKRGLCKTAGGRTSCCFTLYLF